LPSVIWSFKRFQTVRRNGVEPFFTEDNGDLLDCSSTGEALTCVFVVSLNDALVVKEFSLFSLIGIDITIVIVALTWLNVSHVE